MQFTCNEQVAGKYSRWLSEIKYGRKMIHIEGWIKRNEENWELSVIKTGKETHQQMQKAYLRGKRKRITRNNNKHKEY